MNMSTRVLLLKSLMVTPSERSTAQDDGWPKLSFRYIILLSLLLPTAELRHIISEDYIYASVCHSVGQLTIIPDQFWMTRPICL